MEEKILLAQRPGNKTIYRCGDVVKKSFGEDYSVSDVFNEANNLANVMESGFPVPELLEVTKEGGRWTIVMRYVEGRTLAEIMQEQPERTDELLDRFVDIQLDMHKRSVPRLARLTEKMHRKISHCGLDATTRYELHTRLNSMPEHTKLCHGDYNPSNVVITEGGEAYVLDWGHATQGNASADAARTYLVFTLSGFQDVGEKYLRAFCQKSDTARQYVNKWLAIVAASQLVKQKEEQRELLMTWANVVEYE